MNRLEKIAEAFAQTVMHPRDKPIDNWSSLEAKHFLSMAPLLERHLNERGMIIMEGKQIDT